MATGITCAHSKSIILGIIFFIIVEVFRKYAKLEIRFFIKHALLFSFGVIYALWRFESAPEINKSQFWKITYQVKIEKIDKKCAKEKVYGYGKIVSVQKKGKKEQNLDRLVGHHVYFYINGRQHYIPSQTVEIKSNLIVLHPKTDQTFYQYLVCQNIYLYACCGEIKKITQKASKMASILDHANLRVHENIQRAIDKSGASSVDGIIYGMLLSEKKELSKKQKANFHNTGTAHLLAVSGLHIGIIGLVLDTLLKCCFLKRCWRRIPIIVLIFIYVAIIHFPPSAVRAWLMLSCFWLSNLFRRPSSGTSSLLLSALLSVIYDPILLFDIGFQLSYGVVAMLLIAGPAISWGLYRYSWILKYRLKKIRKTKLLRKRSLSKREKSGFFMIQLISLFSASIASTLASAPLTFEYFNMFSLNGIFVNPVVIQLALPIVGSGFLFLLTSFVFRDSIINNICFWVMRTLIRLVDWLLNVAEDYIPWHVEFWKKPSMLGLDVFIVILFISWLCFLFVKSQNSKRVLSHSLRC